MHLKLQPRTCPICNKSDAILLHEQQINAAKLDEFAFASRKYPEYMHLRLVKCNICTLIYADPAPDSSSLHHEYEKAAFDSGDEAKFAAKTYLHYLPSTIRPQSALDIGCGGGEFLEMLLNIGVKKIHGVEPSLNSANTACDKVREYIEIGMFDDNDFESGSFDLISSFQTLEHVSEPLELICGAYKLLKKGGNFYSVCHNYDGTLNRLLGTSSPIYDIEHLQLFSPKSLKKLLETAGFTDIRIFPIWNKYPIGYWVKMLPVSLTFKKQLIKLLQSTKIASLSFSAPVGNIGVLGTKAMINHE